MANETEGSPAMISNEPVVMLSSLSVTSVTALWNTCVLSVVGCMGENDGRSGPIQCFVFGLCVSVCVCMYLIG